MLAHQQQQQQDQLLNHPNTRQRQQQQRVILQNQIDQLRAQKLPPQEFQRRVNVLRRRLTKARRRLRYIDETSVSLQRLLTKQETYMADLKRDIRMLPADDAYRERRNELRRKLKRASRLLWQVKREQERIHKAARSPQTSFDGVDLDEPGGPETLAFLQRVKMTFEHEPQVAGQFRASLIQFASAPDRNASRDAIVQECRQLFANHPELLTNLIEILNRQVE